MSKSKELEQFLQKMNKQFGDNALCEYGEGIANVEAIPTGLPSLDYNIGVGGMPRGRIIEIYGPEGAGKTTIAIKLMANAQHMEGQLPLCTVEGQDPKPLTGRVGFIDVEHAFSPSLAELHGLKMGKDSGFFFTQPTGGDEALQMLESMVCSDLFDVIVVDSVAGLTTLDEQEKEIGKQVMAGTAQLMSSGLKKLVPLIGKSRTVVIFINQIREKPAVMYGTPEVTPGGKALKFYSSVRIRVSKKDQIKEGSQQIGHTMGISIKKNKVAPPFRDTEIDLLYSDGKDRPAGFDVFGDMLQVATAMKIVELRGSSYQYVNAETGEVHKAVGKVRWREYLENNPHVYDEIIKEVNEYGITKSDEQPQSE